MAAARAALNPTGYVARMAVARLRVRPLPADTGGTVRELVEAWTQLHRYATLLNQAVAKLHSTASAGALPAAVERCHAAVGALHAAVARLGRPAPKGRVAKEPGGCTGGGR